MKNEGLLRIVRALRERRPAAVAGAAVLVLALLSAGAAFGVAVSASPDELAVGTFPPTSSPTWMVPTTLLPSVSPTTGPAPEYFAATTDGVYLPAYQETLATRHPIAVMLDDHWFARPQAGLSQADVVYHAPAESGIPRYMAIFQTQDPELIGPIRSSRKYFVEWAEEWRAMYVHCGGAPNALDYLKTINKVSVWNADEFRWGGKEGFMWRVDWRAKPHNVYTSGQSLQQLARKIGATAPYTTSPFTFADEVPLESRPVGGTIKVEYEYNTITYRYDRATNTYLRWVTGDVIHNTSVPQIDPNNGQQIAPSNVIILTQKIYALAGEHNLAKHRLDVKDIGSGSAMVFNNGQVIPATWSKKSHTDPTYIYYASGPLKGKPVPMVRGQIFIQVVFPDLPVTVTPGVPGPPPVIL
jgi:hypothetical protein